MAARSTSAVDISNHPSLPSRWLWAIGLALVGLVAVAAALIAWDRREAVYASDEREMTNLAVALAEHAARSLQAVDLVLRETQAEVLATGMNDPAQLKQTLASEDMHRFLRHHSKNLPQADAIGLVAADGTLVSGSRYWPVPSINFTDSESYQYLRDHDDPGVYCSRPVIAKATGTWAFFLARRIDGPAHQFLGIAVARIQGRYFEDFYRVMSLHEDGSIALFERDGTMLARYPHAEAMVGKRLPPAAPFYAAVRNGGGSFRSRGYVDGIARIISVRPLRDYPLAVAVTTGDGAVLAEWRRQTWGIAGGAFCMAVAVVVLFGGLAARSRRLEQHNAELTELAEALGQSETRFRDFAMASSHWLWETDARHRLAYLSDGVLTHSQGTDPGGILGRTRWEKAADAESDPAKWQEHRALLERHERFRDFIHLWKNEDGAGGVASISGEPIFDDAGVFVGYRGTGRDVTEQFLAERRLYEAKAAAEAANYAKTQLLANVSHELRTPLNAILGFSEMLELGIAGELQKKQVEYVALIRQSGHHLLEVINDILDFAKVDAGKLDLHEDHQVDAHQIIDGCFAIINERARTGQLNLSATFDEPLPLLVVDETRVKQILLNLLSNAIKFTRAGGSVVVSISCTKDGGMAFAVRDTGAGMTPEELEIAMEPFGQVDAGLARAHEGTGLGLPLARRLAELHGGSLSIESEKGRGTVVTLLLPPARIATDSAEPGRAAA